MSISDTQSAKKYASIAEVAAAQAKMYALELENAPDYASEAQAAATAATASSDTASQYASNAATAAASSSLSANDAANSAAEAAAAAGGAINQTVRAPTGESLTALPAAASRINQFIVTGAAGDVEVMSRDSVPVLDSSGKLPVSVIPAIALTEPFVVNSEAAMLALDAQPGDIAKRTDLGYSFCLAASPASTLSNWVQLTDDVLAQLGLSSGATQVGATSLSGASSTVQAELNKKPDSTDLAASTGAAAIGATTDAGATTTVQGALALKIAATTLSGTGSGQGALITGYNDPSTGATTVAAALTARLTAAALLAANGSEIGYQYASDASLRNMQSRLVENLSVLDYYESSDGSDYGIALNRIFTKYASSTGFSVSFPVGTFSIITPAVYSGTAQIFIRGQQATTLILAGTQLSANISITSTRRITIEDIEIEVIPPTVSGTKIGIYMQCTGQDVSHNIRNVRATTTISTSGSYVLMFDMMDPSLSSWSDVYVRYFGDYALVTGSNNIAWRLRASTKISTDSMFRNCSVVGCEYAFVVNPPVGGTNGAYLEGITWIGCTLVSVLQGVYISGDNSNAYRSPMYRWIGGHIMAYQRCFYAYWVSQIFISDVLLYLPYSSTYSGALGLFAIWLEQTVETHIRSLGSQLSAQAATQGQTVHVGPGCKYTVVTDLSCYTSSQAIGVVSYSGSYWTRAGNVVVFYSGTASSAAVSLNGTTDVDMGNNTVYAA